jgi:MFS family permease
MALGPVIGGFLATAAGWRWVEGLLAAFSGVLWLCMRYTLPVRADIFSARRRNRTGAYVSGNKNMIHSQTISLFAAAPFLGPTLGPVIGGFLATAAGWRWVEGADIFSARRRNRTGAYVSGNKNMIHSQSTPENAASSPFSAWYRY